MAKKIEVAVGQVWSAKISQRLVTVRVDSIISGDGKTKYALTNLKTGRKVGPYTASKLRMRHRHLEAANNPGDA